LAYAAMSSSYQRSHSVPMCQHDPQSSRGNGFHHHRRPP
jgi:hypothetical protein